MLFQPQAMSGYDSVSPAATSPMSSVAVSVAASIAAAAAAEAHTTSPIESLHPLNGTESMKPHQTSSRILYDIPCKVCTDHSSGKHYGIFACDGCAGFFKRSIRRNRQYVCKAKSEGTCLVDKTHRNQCRACRLKRCTDVGMNKDAVQHERGPRNSTLRRQMSLYFKEQQLHASQSPPLAVEHGSSNGSTPVHPGTRTSATPPKPTAASPTQSPSTPSPQPAFPSPAAAAAFHQHLSMLAATNTQSPPMFFPRPPVTPPRIPTSPVLVPTPKYPHEMSLAPPPLIPINAVAAAAAAASARQLGSDSLSEIAARVLFMNVRWAQNVPAFTSLPYKDQLLLLDASWRELFILSAAQFALPVEFAALQCRDVSVLSELKHFQEAIAKFQALNVDATEFACLRAIVLLKTCVSSGESDGEKEVRDQAAISALQDQAQLTLSKYIAGAYPHQPSRFGKLLLLLPSLKSVSSKAIEDLFFKKTIGAIPIEKIICDMFKAGPM